MDNLFNSRNQIVKELYQSLLKELKQFGPVIEEPKKTSIHLKNKAGFAGVHPRKDYLIVNIVTSETIISPRIVKQEQVSKSRFHNEIKLESPQDIDAELISWLQSAYTLMQ